MKVYYVKELLLLIVIYLLKQDQLILKYVNILQDIQVSVMHGEYDQRRAAMRQLLRLKKFPIGEISTLAQSQPKTVCYHR